MQEYVRELNIAPPSQKNLLKYAAQKQEKKIDETSNSCNSNSDIDYTLFDTKATDLSRMHKKHGLEELKKSGHDKVDNEEVIRLPNRPNGIKIDSVTGTTTQTTEIKSPTSFL